MARNDSESLILSLRNGSPRVSCYQPDLVADYRMLFAFYNADGRFAELPVIRDVSQSYVLSNYELPDGIAAFTIFTLDREMFVPLTGAKKY